MAGRVTIEKLSRRMVSRKVAAEMYGYAPGTLANLLSQGRGPRAFRCGKKILYAISDLEEYFRANPILTKDSLPDDQT